MYAKKSALRASGVSLSAQSETSRDVPLANVHAFYEAWEEETK